MGKKIIHVIMRGGPLCEKTDLTKWPDPHSRVYDNCAAYANCEKCLAIFAAIKASDSPETLTSKVGTLVAPARSPAPTAPAADIPTYVWPIMILFLIAGALYAVFREKGFSPWVSVWLVRLILAPAPFFTAWVCAWFWKREWHKPFMWATIATSIPVALLIFMIITATGA